MYGMVSGESLLDLAVLGVGEFFTSLGRYVTYAKYEMAVIVWCNKKSAAFFFFFYIDVLLA